MDREHRFFVGLDLGQASDYTAINVQEQQWNEEKTRYEYKLRYLERFRGVPYPDVVKKVSAMMLSEKLQGASEPPRLILDKTGVGAPVADMFRIGPIRPIEITITGGQNVNVVPKGYNVPKRDLVFALLGVYQGGRFKASNALPLAKVFLDELMGFKVKIDIKTGHDSYEAWREGIHDDLVLSVALATWYGEYRYGRRVSKRFV
ncbi:MAG: hypothetical protein WC291_10835 [Thermodesulfovibrionales bacterium]|jgi:hypothetical protein